jgi:serine/threonine-protein kinase
VRLPWVAAAVAAVLAAALTVGLTRGDGEQPTGGASTAASTTTTARSTPSQVPTSTTTTANPDGPALPGDIVGRQRDAVVDELIALGVNVRWVIVRSPAPEGSVIGTVPAAGTRLTRGQTVVLVVSRGEAPANSNTTWVVPDGLVGTEAKRSLERLGKEDVRVSKVSIPSSGERGTVIATWPSAGERTADGVVVLVISSGPDD